MKQKMKNIDFKSILLVVFLLAGNIVSCQSNSSDNVKLSTTIHEAVFMNNVEQVKAHITKGTDLDEKDQYGSTPLSIAATFNKVDVAELLIKGGADLKAASPDGTTALHTAVFLCRTDIVDLLLENNADASVKNGYGATPLMSIQAPFEQMRPIYEQMNKDLGMLGLKLDYDFLESEREVIADMLIDYMAQK